MKVVQLATEEGAGGAAKAAFRLHQTFYQAGLQATLLVSHKQSDYPGVYSIIHSLLDRQKEKFQNTLDFLPVRFYQKRLTNDWSPAWFSPYSIVSSSLIQEADVLVLYWVTGGYLSIKEIGRLLSLGKPVVWRLSDMWPFTGGCHYSSGCLRYQEECQQCPKLNAERGWDLAHWVHSQKKKILEY